MRCHFNQNDEKYIFVKHYYLLMIFIEPIICHYAFRYMFENFWNTLNLTYEYKSISNQWIKTKMSMIVEKMK